MAAKEAGLPTRRRLHRRRSSEIEIKEEIDSLGIVAAAVNTVDCEFRKIGLITSGGDCGGLNAVIKGATLTAHSYGIPVVVIPNGYAGLYNLVNIDRLVELTPKRTDAVRASLAGSEAGHSRVKIRGITDEDKYKRIKEGLEKHCIDGLVISGGDDTGSVIIDLVANGIPCVHAPKTMDMDLQTYSVGADSTINRIAQFVRDLRTTAITHGRILVVEVFGRYAGHTAFRGGVGAEADCILIPEIPVDFDLVYADMVKTFKKRVTSNFTRSGTYMIVVSEGLTDVKGSHIVDKNVARDAFGHVKLHGASNYVVEEMSKRMAQDEDLKKFMQENAISVEDVFEIPEIRSVIPGHLVRCGMTSAYDVNFGMQVGGAAVRLLVGGRSGVTVVDMRGEEIFFVPTEVAIEQRHVDLNVLPLFEQMGFFFGRKAAQDEDYSFEKLSYGQRPIRHM